MQSTVPADEVNESVSDGDGGWRWVAGKRIKVMVIDDSKTIRTNCRDLAEKRRF